MILGEVPFDLCLEPGACIGICIEAALLWVRNW